MSQLGLMTTYAKIIHSPDTNPSDPACLKPWSGQIKKGSIQSFNRVLSTKCTKIWRTNSTWRTENQEHISPVMGSASEAGDANSDVAVSSLLATLRKWMIVCLLRFDISSAPVIILSLLVQFSCGRIQLAQCFYIIIMEDVVHLLVKNIIIHLQ